MDINRILVPFDFSKHSLNALKAAESIFAKTAGTIELLNVIELPVINDPLMLPAFTYETSLLNELTAATLAHLNKVTAGLKGNNVRVIPKQLFGHLSDTIAEESKQDFDLLVIGFRGTGGLSEFIMGSTAMKVLRRSAAPVLVVKEPFQKAIKTIVFPHSLETEGQQELAEKITSLQKLFNASARVICINNPNAFTSDDTFAKRLNDFKRNFPLPDFQGAIYKHDDEAEGICQYAKSVSAELIVMSTHGRTGIGHLTNTSVTEQVIHRSDIPVWAYSLKKQQALA